MAEDKKIRISTDASGVQTLRQNISQFYSEIEGKSKGWRQMAESDIDAIYDKWEKLIQLREKFQRTNSVSSTRFDQMVPEFNQTDQRLTNLQSDRLSFLNNTRLSGDNSGAGGGGLFGFLRRIALALERRNRNDEHTVAGRRAGQQIGGSGGASGGGLNWQGALGQAAGGNLIGATGTLLGGGLIAAGLSGVWGLINKSFERNTAVYNANNSIQRELEKERFWDFLPWTKSANDRASAALDAYSGNLRTQYLLGSAYGVSSDTAFRSQFANSKKVTDGDDVSWGRIGTTAAGYAGGGAAIGAGIGTLILPGLGTLIGAGIGGLIGLVGGGASEYAQEQQRVAGSYEVQDIYSNYLGKSVTEAGQDIYAYKRAGVKGGNKTSIDDIFNTMLAEKIYNLDRSTLTNAYSATRFGSENRGIGSIASAFERQLKWQTNDPNEIGVRLQESLNLYTKMAQGMLGARGSFKQSDVIGTINALQGLGLEGQQLERITSGLLGINGGGSDPITRALRLQAASQTGVHGMLDLQASLEAPTEEMQKKLIANLWRGSGGDKDYFGINLAKTLGLKAADVRDLLNKQGVIEDGNLNIHALFEGATKGGYFDANRARALTTEMERSSAATENRKIAEGGIQAMEGKIYDSVTTIASKVDQMLNGTMKVKITGISPEAQRGMGTTVKVNK